MSSSYNALLQLADMYASETASHAACFGDDEPPAARRRDLARDAFGSALQRALAAKIPAWGTVATRARCQCCSGVIVVDFRVPDEVWEAVVHPQFHHSYLCINCFASHADEKRIDWAPLVEMIPCSLVSQDVINSRPVAPEGFVMVPKGQLRSPISDEAMEHLGFPPRSDSSKLFETWFYERFPDHAYMLFDMPVIASASFHEGFRQAIASKSMVGGPPYPLHRSQSFSPDVLKWHSFSSTCPACDGRQCNLRALAIEALGKQQK